MVSIALDSITATQAVLTASDFAADGTIEVQVSPRADFAFCVCPIVTALPRTSPVTIDGLNQDASYYLRARDRSAGDVASAWGPVLGIHTPVAVPRDTSPDDVMIHPAIVVVPCPVLEWTGEDEVAGFPAANLGYDAPVAWRSRPGGDGHVVTARIAPAPVDTIAILNTNLPEGAEVTIQAGATSAAEDFSFGPVPFRASADVPGRTGYHGLFRLNAPESYEYWRIEITAELFGGLLHAEHVVLGLRREAKNYASGKSEASIDLGTMDRTSYGVPIRNQGYRMRRAAFEIAVMREELFETQFADLMQKVGSTDPVLCVPNAKANAFLHDRILYGVITDGRATNPASPVFTRSFQIDSLI